jgi:hypothetical protein
MLTQATPAIVKALQGVLPPNALKQLTQALGNCNQPLTHRGDVNFQPNYSVGNERGVYGGDGSAPWNPEDYRGLFPAPGERRVFTSGGGGNRTYSNYQGNQYDFSNRQQFNLNQFYGGDTVNNYERTGRAGRDGRNGAAGRGGFSFRFVGPAGRDTQDEVVEPGGGGGFGSGGGGFGVGIGVGVFGGLIRLRTDTITVPQYRAVIGSLPIPTNAIQGGSVKVSIPQGAGSTKTLTNAIKGGSVTVPVLEQAMSSVAGTVDIPAPSAIAVSYDKATSISGGTATYDKATGVSGGSASYDKATGVSGNISVSLPTPSGTVTITPSSSSVQVVTSVSASFDSSTCTVKITPTYATISNYSGFSATFTGKAPGAVTASASGLSLTTTSTPIDLAGLSITNTPASLSLSGLSLTHTSTKASVTGGFSGGNYKIETFPTYVAAKSQNFTLTGETAYVIIEEATYEDVEVEITGEDATVDQRAVVTSLASQNPIRKTFYAP